MKRTARFPIDTGLLNRQIFANERDYVQFIFD